MVNPLLIWEEVKQKNISASDDKLEDVLEFPERIIVDRISYDKIKVCTTKEQNGYLNRLYYSSHCIRISKLGIGEICGVHADALNFLRGEYVKQHRNGAE